MSSGRQDLPAAVDAVVVGGGTAGCAVAAFLAESGLRVLVLERRALERAGARWINGVPAWCFAEAGVALPRPPERWGSEGRHDFWLEVAHSARAVRVPEAPTLHVDMRHLNARLREHAHVAGAAFWRGRAVELTPYGARARTLRWVDEGGHARDTRAALFVDASGHAAVLRKQRPARGWAMEASMSCAAAQHQFKLAEPRRLEDFLGARGARLGDSLGIVGSEGGFSTLTLFTAPDSDEIGVLTGSLPHLGHAPGETMLRRFIGATPWIGGRSWGGAGPIALGPLARPLGADGVALVGESAGQVYASHGSGVGLGLVGARLLARAAASEGDPGHPRALAAYDASYRSRFAGLLSRSLRFFHVARKLDSATTAALLTSGVLHPGLLRAALEQVDPPLDARSVLRLGTSAARQPGMLLQLARAALRED